MSRWFRFYDDAINDPKILKLPEATRWHWVALLCIASKNDGVLPPTDDIALMLRVKPSVAATILASMKQAGLLDAADGKFTPHNWSVRQFKSDTSNERVKRYRQRKCNVTDTVTVTPPDTDTDTDTEKGKETRASALVVDDGWPNDFREQFWNRYPNKVGKPKALAKLEGVRKRRVPWLSVMDGLERYIREKPLDRAWLNPETFINQERWADQPAPVMQGNSNGRRTVQDAARDLHENLLRKVALFDEPAPRGLCERESEDVVRLLPARRCQ